jgi:hypothetical protein
MSTKYLTSINLAQNALLNAAMHPLAAAPGSPVAGQVYFDTTLGQFGVWSGTAWTYLAGCRERLPVGELRIGRDHEGVRGASTVITDYTGGVGLVKSTSAGVVSPAVAGTDYLAPAGNGSALTGLTQSQISGLTAALALLAPLASAVLIGAPTAPTPTTSTGIATKGYVDGLVQGISAKYSAVAATTGTETFTIVSGSVTQISGTTLDGQSPNVGDYVLVKDAPSASGTGSAGSSQPGNGLYQVTGNTTNLSLSRAADMSGSNPPVGAYVFVAGIVGTSATSNAGFSVTTPNTSAAFTYGTGNIQFTQFNGAADVIAGTGLSKSGNTLSLATLTGKYTATIGDGSSTSITVTHSLGTRAVIARIYDAATYVEYQCDITNTSTSVITLGFTTAPSANSLVVVVIG